MQSFDVTPYLSQDEGQHYERKSLLDRRDGGKRPRGRREVRDQVARYVAAFANAEGGVLILGLEDDGSITGHRYPDSARDTLLAVPRTRLEPPQPAGFVVRHGGVELLVFDVPTSDVPVRVTGDGFPLRMGDQTVETGERQIQQLKFTGMVESWESRPSAATLADLDRRLLARARQGAGLAAITDEEYLLRRKLADRRGAGIALRRAAELVFAAHGPDHANAGVRVFRVIGRERRLGAEHNVEERPRIEGNLASVVEQAMDAIGGLLRRPSRLVGARFQPQPEYPDFSWREAVLNAIAHRDYSTEGRAIEVWLFDDRMEVVSPGGLVPGVALDDLLRMERVHSSRNPRLVRALVDLGFMRDQGEGIPRMFAEMEGSFLPAPELTPEPHRFRVVLQNTPTLRDEDRAFIAHLDTEGVERDEFRALLEAWRHGRVDNARMRRLAGLDTLQASQLLRRLRDRGLLELHAAGSASYYTLASSLRPGGATAAHRDGLPSDGDGLRADGDGLRADGDGLRADGDGLRADGDGLRTDGDGLRADGDGLRADGDGLPSDGDGLPSDGDGLRADGDGFPAEGRPGGDDGQDPILSAELPSELERALTSLGERPRKDKLRPVILALGTYRAWRPFELARVLGRSNVRRLVHDHLVPLVADGLMERTEPDNPTHPDQAYRTTAQGRVHGLPLLRLTEDT